MALSSDKFFEYDNANTHGAKMPRGDKKAISEYLIPIPSFELQTSIVSELNSINDSILLLHEQVKDLDVLAQALFYDMFGDPYANTKQWDSVKLGTIAEPTIGLTYKPENVSSTEEGTIVLRSSNIQESELTFEDIVRVNVPIKEDKFVKDGDILMCSRNGSFKLVGKVAMIKGLPERMSYGAFMTIIRSDYNPYLFAYFKTPAFREHMNLGKTSTVNQVTVNMLKNICLPLPPHDLQRDFASKISIIDEAKNQMSKHDMVTNTFYPVSKFEEINEVYDDYLSKGDSTIILGYYWLLGKDETEKVLQANGYLGWNDYLIRCGATTIKGKPSFSIWKGYMFKELDLRHGDKAVSETTVPLFD